VGGLEKTNRRFEMTMKSGTKGGDWGGSSGYTHLLQGVGTGGKREKVVVNPEESGGTGKHGTAPGSC